MKPKSEWVLTDFNGILAPGLLYLSHADEVKTALGLVISLKEGMALTAYDLDANEEGKPDNIFASGVVERSPSNAPCNGSIWSLRIDSNGIRHESDIE
ncbi:MAG: hypothetical protein JSS39_01010 [Nitrospira sp.]|nr:hypothetical protein [Nitrospira sp.]